MYIMVYDYMHMDAFQKAWVQREVVGEEGGDEW